MKQTKSPAAYLTCSAWGSSWSEVITKHRPRDEDEIRIGEHHAFRWYQFHTEVKIYIKKQLTNL